METKIHGALLPVIFFYCYFFSFFISSGHEKIKFIENLSSNPDIVMMVLYPSLLISGFSYIFLTFLLLRRHHRNILNNLSNSNENNNLHWLRNLLSGMLVIWLVVLVGHIVLKASLRDPAIYISVTLFVVFIGFYGLRQGNIFMNLPDGYLIEGLTEDNQQRYSKSGLKEEQAAEIKQQLARLMEEKRIFWTKISLYLSWQVFSTFIQIIFHRLSTRDFKRTSMILLIITALKNLKILFPLKRTGIRHFLLWHWIADLIQRLRLITLLKN